MKLFQDSKSNNKLKKNREKIKQMAGKVNEGNARIGM